MKEDKEFNPLEGWTKDQVKSALKANTKTSLLKAAIQWRMMAENLQIQINKLKETDDDTTTEDTTDGTDS
jgi:hypothetical protein